MEVDDPAKAAERQAEQERLQRSARVRKRQEERAAREQEAKAHEEAQQAAEEQQFQRSAKVRRDSSTEEAASGSERRKPKLPQHNPTYSAAHAAASQPDFDSVSDGEHSFAEFMVDEDDDKLLVPANINSNADLCTVLDEVLAVSSDLSKDICEELEVYGGSAERYRQGCQLQGSRHDASPDADNSTKPSSLIYPSMGLVDENGTEMKPFTLKQADKIRKTAMLLRKPRYVLKFLSEKLRSMPMCAQTEADDPIFHHQYKASLFKEYTDTRPITWRLEIPAKVNDKPS